MAINSADEPLAKKTPYFEIDDKRLFVAAFACGFVAIAVFKGLLDWPIVAMIVPVLVMMAYAYAVSRHTRDAMREEFAGDSAYYLGFLFTLISLSIALIQFNVGHDSGDQVAASFGIALATTITGLALRVFLGRLAQSPTETETEAREALTGAAHALRTELDQSVEELRTFRQRVMQTSTELVEGVSGEAKKAIEEAARELRGAAKDVRGDLVGSFKEFGKAATQLQGSATRVGKAAEQFAARVENLRLDEALLEKTLLGALEPVRSAMEKVSDEIQATASAHAAVREQIFQAAASIAQFAEPLGELDLATGGLSKGLSAVSESQERLGAFTEQMKRTQEQLKELDGSVDRLHSGIDSSGRAFESLGSQLDKDATSVRDAVTQLSSHFEKLAGEIGQQSNAFNRGGEAFTTLGRHAGEAASTLESAGTAAIRLNETLGQLTNRLVGPLEAVGGLAENLDGVISRMHGVPELSNVIGEATRLLGVVNQEMGAQVAVARRHREELEKDLAAARDATRELHTSLTSLATLVVQQLQ